MPGIPAGAREPQDQKDTVDANESHDHDFPNTGMAGLYSVAN